MADIFALDDYAWSGHGVIMGNGEMVGLASNEVLALFARSRGEAKRRYRQFVADGVAQGKRMRRELAPELSAAVGIRELIDRVCARFAVDPETLQLRTRAAGVADIRSIVCYLAGHHLRANGAEVGRHLGLGRSGVSVAARRGERLVKNDSSLLTLIDK